MSAGAPSGGKPYNILGAPTHVRRWDEAHQAVLDGWDIRAQWLANGSVVRVFVPDDADIAAAADALIRHQGAQLDALHS